MTDWEFNRHVKILSIQYTKTKPHKNYLLLCLGDDAEKIYGLLINDISDHDRNNILSNINALTRSTYTQRMEWLRKMMPNYGYYYRTLFKKYSVITRSDTPKQS